MPAPGALLPPGAPLPLPCVFELAPVAMAVAAPDGSFRRTNALFRALTGYTADQLRASSVFSLTPQSELDSMFDVVSSLIHKGKQEAKGGEGQGGDAAGEGQATGSAGRGKGKSKGRGKGKGKGNGSSSSSLDPLPAPGPSGGEASRHSCESCEDARAAMMVAAQSRPLAGTVGQDGCGTPMVHCFRKMCKFRRGAVSSLVSMSLLRASDGQAQMFVCSAIPVLPPSEGTASGTGASSHGGAAAGSQGSVVPPHLREYMALGGPTVVSDWAADATVQGRAPRLGPRSSKGEAGRGNGRGKEHAKGKGEGGPAGPRSEPAVAPAAHSSHSQGSEFSLHPVPPSLPPSSSGPHGQGPGQSYPGSGRRSGRMGGALPNTGPASQHFSSNRSTASSHSSHSSRHEGLQSLSAAAQGAFGAPLYPPGHPSSSPGWGQGQAGMHQMTGPAEAYREQQLHHHRAVHLQRMLALQQMQNSMQLMQHQRDIKDEHRQQMMTMPSDAPPGAPQHTLRLPQGQGQGQS